MPNPATQTALAPLAPERAELLARLLEGLDAPSLWWISGYTAATAAARQAHEPGAGPVSANTVAAEAITATVLYGSQTGNAAKLASKLHQQLIAGGIPAKLVRADAYPLKALREEKLLYVVISTQGDGDPPEDARGFVEQLLSSRAPALKQLQFAVLGLGDSSYPKFNSVAKSIDLRFAELGATRLFARGDADVEIDQIAGPWLDKAFAHAQEHAKAQAKSVRPLASVSTLPTATSARPQFRADRPFAAALLASQRLTTPTSTKDIRHLELSLEDSGLRYLPGDALGVYAQNPASTVEALLQTLGWKADAEVSIDTQSTSVAHALSAQKEITRVNKPFIAALAERSKDSTLLALLKPENSSQLSSLLGEAQLIDVLQRHPTRWDPQSLIPLLRPLKPRMYSIASSQRSVGEEVHLTVAHVQYQVAGQPRFGAASHFLANAQLDAKLPVFVESNDRFRLPSDPGRDVIMIGPGTGVAPFRAFVQERIELGASGRNWLFFGNPHFHSDFLYQLEWQQALKAKQLHRLDVAFSRDEPGVKTYVQHRLLAQGAEVYRWLENGAHLYVCGDATHMAKDVESALIQIIATEKQVDRDSAREYLLELAQQKRYQRDIY